MPTFYNFKKDGYTYSFDDVFVKTDPFTFQGNLWIWGRGIVGALGNLSSSSFAATPITTFSAQSPWKKVSTGGAHSAGIKSDGTLWIWGSNAKGQLGNATFNSVDTPITTFTGGSNWIDVSTGTDHTAAIKTDGTLWTWGDTYKNQLGINIFDFVDRSTPVTTFTGGTNWKQVSCGYRFTSAVKTNGTLWSWGYSLFGQLGTGAYPTTVRSTPVTTFAGGTNWADISEDYYTIGAGAYISSAIKTDGTLWIWGRNGVGGQLGTNDTTPNRLTPVTTFAGGTSWKKISCSGYNVASIKTDGTLWIWGQNTFGQLGINNITNTLTPVTTFVGGTDWRSVSTGRVTTAIKTDGTLWIWGNNGSGQLGINATGNRSTPVTTFAGGTNWNQCSNGSEHVGAVKNDGTLWLWGRGFNGRLGDGTYGFSDYRSTPVTTFAGGTNWKQVSCGGYHTAAVKTNGTLWTWGLNSSSSFGALGNASTILSSTPVTTFAGGTNWKQVSAGDYHTAAIKTDGTLWTWGDSNNGKLGNGSSLITSTPVTTFIGGTDWKQVHAGYHTIAFKNDKIYLFGENGSGTLGTNDTVNRSTPVTTFAGGTNWANTLNYSTITAGRSSVAIKTDGTLWTWGTQIAGGLGNAVIDTSIDIPTPITTFAGGTNWYQVDTDSYVTAAIKTDGTLWLWGESNNGVLGTRDITPFRSTPVTTFAGGTNWKQVSTSGGHTAAIKTDGTLWIWGFGSGGRLGNFQQSDKQTPVTTFAGGTNWKQVSAGNAFTAAIKTDGTLWLWGGGTSGQLGTNDTANRSTPVTTFAGGTDWSQVSAGQFSSCSAIKTDGTLWTWGVGNQGRLGINSTGNRSTPVTTFAGGTNWLKVSTGYDHTAAIKTDGTLWLWGVGDNGELGNAIGAYTFGNPNFVRSTPVTTFIGGTDWLQVSAGRRFTIALKGTNNLLLFGSSLEGAIGDGSYQFNVGMVPEQVTGNFTNWKQVSCGYHSTAAVKTDGTLWTWGYGYQGQLGNNSLDSSNVPITTFAGGTNWKQVSMSGYYSVQACAAIKTDGTLWTWGNQFSGFLGNAINNANLVSTPITTFAGGTNWKEVSTGGYHMSAIKTDGTLWTWGSNDQVALGNNSIVNASTPVTTFLGGNTWIKTGQSGGYRVIAIKY